VLAGAGGGSLPLDSKRSIRFPPLF